MNIQRLHRRLFTFSLIFLIAAAGALLMSGPAEASNVDVLSLYGEDEKPGQDACVFLEAIAHAFPQRINNNGYRSSNVNAAGQWISQQLAGFGYDVIEVPYVHIPSPETNFTGIDYAAYKPGVDNSHIIVVGAHYDSVDTEGAEDNGSGVSCVLEMAKRFRDVPTPCSILFVLFDNEEQGGYVGSYHFIEDYLDANGLTNNVIADINIDCVAGGDRLHCYGGYYDDDMVLHNEWLYLEANRAANRTGSSLYSMPEQVEMYRTPSRVLGSDHCYFNIRGIPYAYFETTRWCLEDGSGGNEHSHLHYHFQTADQRLDETGGQIMHTRFDNFNLLNDLFPGRIQENLENVITIVSSMLLETDANTGNRIMSGELSLTSFPEDEPPTTEEETTEEETEEETTEEETEEPETTEPDTEEGMAPLGNNSGGNNSRRGSSLSGEHNFVRNIFILVGAVLILIILFLAYLSITRERRRKKHIHTHNGPERKL